MGGGGGGGALGAEGRGGGWAFCKNCVIPVADWPSLTHYAGDSSILDLSPAKILPKICVSYFVLKFNTHFYSIYDCESHMPELCNSRPPQYNDHFGTGSTTWFNNYGATAFTVLAGLEKMAILQ